MELLWSNHFWLTRAFVVDTVTNSPFAKSTLDALMQNQIDLGDNLALYYGVQNGAIYTRLLREHIEIAGAIVGAAIKGQNIDHLNNEWKRNGLEIAYFLYSLNPRFFTLQGLQHHMLNHLSTTLDEAVSIIQKKPEESVIKGDIALAHVNAMARDIVAGINAQIDATYGVQARC